MSLAEEGMILSLMRVLVTGSEGYIGARLVPILIARGLGVVASTPASTGTDGFIATTRDAGIGVNDRQDLGTSTTAT
jgi:nucleoside-diphosphate-sugar epimerase